MTQAIRTRETYTKNQALWTDGKTRHQHPCLWMQAGVAAKNYCNNFYDCTSCKYDAAMLKLAQSGRQPTWQQAMRLKPGSERTCRHAMTGRADHRTCPLNYHCERCDFDQYFEETMSQGTGHTDIELKDVKGFKLPSSYYFHEGHTWAIVESGGIIRIGMDDFSFKVLGGPDHFEMPLIGQEFNMGTPAWGIKRNQFPADVLSPVNGVITKVNADAVKNPDKPADQPYEDGWLFTVHNSDIKGVIKQLMAQDQSERWLNQEIDTLEEMIETVAGPMSTDGGLLQRDVFGNLPGLGWDHLTRTFLKS